MFKQIYVNRLIKHTEEVMVLNFISRFSKILNNIEGSLSIRCNARLGESRSEARAVLPAYRYTLRRICIYALQ